MGRQVRPDGGVPEFRHCPDDLPVWRLLFGPVLATVLATTQPLESVFLHNRWFSLRLLQYVGYFALCQSWDCSNMLPGGIMVDIADVEDGLQDPAVTLARAPR